MSMEECMRLCMRKLALWQTTTFKPLMTHDELEPIMATMGFVGLPPYQGSSALAWKEYVYAARRPKSFSSLRSTADEPPPATELRRPKLPYPRIDGLHIYTYRAFLDAVNFYIQMWNISDVFHIRGMPIHPSYDRCQRWRCMEDDSIFVYREGTLEGTTYNLYHFIMPNSGSGNNGSCNEDDDYSSVVVRDKGNSDRVSCFVPLKDIIVCIV